MKGRKRWEWGHKKKLASAVGISPQYLSEILAGRKQCRPDLAAKLALASLELGYKISRYVWAFPDRRTGNPLF